VLTAEKAENKSIFCELQICFRIGPVDKEQCIGEGGGMKADENTTCGSEETHVFIEKDTNAVSAGTQRSECISYSGSINHIIVSSPREYIHMKKVVKANMRRFTCADVLTEAVKRFASKPLDVRRWKAAASSREHRE